MKKTLKYYTLIFLCLSLLSCKTNEKQNSKIFVTTQDSGYIALYPEGTSNNDSFLVYSEASGIGFINNKLYIAIDKPVDKFSPISINNFPLNNEAEILYLTENVYNKAIKFEDLCLTNSGKNILFTTAFDRASNEIPKLNYYNMLLAFNLAKNSTTTISTNNSDTTSVSFRDIFKNLLTTHFQTDASYFKIEGLTTIPGDTLLIGVREIGETYLNYTYTTTILCAKYKEDTDNFQIITPFEIWSTPIVDTFPNINEKLGLSGLAFDKFNNRVYMLTSYETGATLDSIGAFLWSISLDKENYKTVQPIFQKDNKPFHFQHKAEGITVIDKQTLFIIHDDDRIITNQTNDTIRKPNEAFYLLLKINEK